MAKALVGCAGAPDPELLSEIRRLRQRLRDLEAELGRMQREQAIAARQHALAASPPQQETLAHG